MPNPPAPLRGPRRLIVVLAAFAGIAIAAFLFWRDATLVLDAPRPVYLDEPVDSLPPTPLSVVEAPVTYDIQTALDSLEAAIPVDYGDLDTRITTQNNKRLSFAFKLKRQPFQVEVRGTTVRITAIVEYSGRLWYDTPIGPEVRMSCGTDDEPPPRAVLTLESTGSLTRDWNLRTQSRLVDLAPYSDETRDRCRLTFLKIDVTGRIFKEVRKTVDVKLVEFDALVARWPVRPRFEKIWRDLQKPFRLADSVYMAVHPVGAEVGEIGAHGGTAYANLRLYATPRVTTGPRPQFELAPLPALETVGRVGRGARVLLDASFDYEVASVMLRKALAGRTLEQGGRRIRIRDVRISGIGGGKVALGVRLGGAVRGRLFLTGTPSFDAATRQIHVPDLDYDVGTAEILVAGYEWLNDVRLRDFLREKARLPDSAVVRRLTRLAHGGMNRPLPAIGTRLSGTIHEAGVVAVRATRDELRVRAIADADLRLAIRRAPSIPRPPEPGAAGDAAERDEEEDGAP